MCDFDEVVVVDYYRGKPVYVGYNDASLKYHELYRRKSSNYTYDKRVTWVIDDDGIRLYSYTTRDERVIRAYDNKGCSSSITREITWNFDYITGKPKCIETDYRLSTSFGWTIPNRVSTKHITVNF